MRLGGGCGQHGGVFRGTGHFNPDHVAGTLADQSGTVEDITESRQAADSLAITLKNIGQGIMRFDAEGRSGFINQSAAIKASWRF